MNSIGPSWISHAAVLEKDLHIKHFEEQVLGLETKIDELVEKVRILEKVKSSSDLDDKIKDIEEKQTYLIEESSGKYKCNTCDFTTYYTNGLKIHKKKMHKVFSCTNCDKIFDTKRDFQVHSYTHSFTNIEKDTNKCKNCEFQSESIDTIEVHVGKCRDENFECGLCGDEFLGRKDVELHLKTCEIYECSSCWLRGENRSEMKKHIREKQCTSTKLNYLKMERENEFEVSLTSYNLKDIF